MSIAGYPDVEAHKKHHDLILSQRTIVNKYEKNPDASATTCCFSQAMAD